MYRSGVHTRLLAAVVHSSQSAVFYWPVYGVGPFPHLDRLDNCFVPTVNPRAIKGSFLFLLLAQRMLAIPLAAVVGWKYDL